MGTRGRVFPPYAEYQQRTERVIPVLAARDARRLGSTDKRLAVDRTRRHRASWNRHAPSSDCHNNRR